MGVKIYKGFGISSRTGGGAGAMYIDMSAAVTASIPEPAREEKETIPLSINNSSLPWSPWGTNNLLCEQMKTDIKSTGILSGIIESKARFAHGEGLLPALIHRDPKTGQRVIDEIITDPEICDWLEMNNHFLHTYSWMKDLMGWNWGVARFVTDKACEKVAYFQRDDLTECRFAKQNPNNGKRERMFYSANWDRVAGPESNMIFDLPLLDQRNPIKDMQEKMASGIIEHSFAFGHQGWGEHYYPTPTWMAAYKWVKIAQGVPEMKAALYENVMRPMYMVIIHDEYWTANYDTSNDEKWDEDTQEKEREKLYNEIDEWLTGSKNAYKSIYVNGMRDDKGTYTGIEIKLIENGVKDGELLPDSAAANSEIAFAFQFNPAIIGASLPSGPYTNSQGGSNVRESITAQIIMTEPERQCIRSIMNIPKYQNGWHERYSKEGKILDFIIPTTILATLDTGSGTKNLINSSPAKDNKNPVDNTNNNGADNNPPGN
jgi:hypothetical protein